MQSQGTQLGRERDTEDRTERLLSQHELDQELLYRMWRASQVTEDLVQSWAESLAELQQEAPCDYFVWLMQRHPAMS